MKKSKSTSERVKSQDTGHGDGVILASVLLVTAATYLGTLRFGFAYDDFQQILTNPFLKSWRYVPRYFATSVWNQLFPFDPGNYYRPLFLLWGRVNYSVFAGRPLGWHASAIGLHVVVTWLVFLIVRRLTERPAAAWLTALIFGLHPIHHEVVAWVSGTTESLFAALFLAAFLAYLKAREGSKTPWMLFSCVLYGLAMLSKETAVVLPGLIFIHSWIAGGPEESAERGKFGPRLAQAATWTALYVPVGLAYVAVRYKVLSGLGHMVSNASFAVWLMTLPSVLFFYVKNWLVPVRLSEEYDLLYQLRPDIAHVILPAILVAALGCVIWRFRNYLGARETCHAAAWIIVPLLPALDYVVFKKDELVHDRYFYVPSLGAALLAALLIERVARKGRAAFGQPLYTVVAAMVLAISLAAGTARATSFWKDDYTLFARAHEIAPLNVTAINDLGVDLIERQQIDRAQSLFEAGLQEDPTNALFLYNLGRVQYIKKNYALAEQYTRKAILINPNGADSYVALGKIQLKQDRPTEAAASFRRSVELDPYDARFHTSYGIVLALIGDCAGATSQFQAALKILPGDVITQTEMSRCSKPQAPGSALTGSPAKPGPSPIQWGFDATDAGPEMAGK